MTKFYFTYGSEGHDYVGGWTEVEVDAPDDYNAAIAAFNVVHPKAEDECIKCASIYFEDEFKKTRMYTEGNFKKFCHERITFKVEKIND